MQSRVVLPFSRVTSVPILFRSCHQGLPLPFRCRLRSIDCCCGCYPRNRPACVPMSSAASVLAVVRAAAPTFRSPQDRLGFAVHSAVLSSGYRLVAVGDQAQLQGLSPDAPDASIAGWNSSNDDYTFAYISEQDDASGPSASAVKLLVKQLVVGDTLLTTLATDNSTAEPIVLELSVSEYVSTTSCCGDGPVSVAKTYKNLDDLVKKLSEALAQLTGTTGTAANSNSQKKQKTEAAKAEGDGSGSAAGQRGLQQPEPLQDPDPDYDPLRIGPPRRPLRVGREDIMPAGGVLPGGPPLVGPGGGGMHVGPGHPFFADRMRHPDVMPGRAGGMPAGPGGIRWDPINPEGLEGWRPDDFQRPGQGRGRGIHPDIGQPGPGRGTDWDDMFG